MSTQCEMMKSSELGLVASSIIMFKFQDADDFLDWIQHAFV